jgi:hypothetical protein
VSDGYWQSGFLRLLATGHGIAAGYGYDPASGAIADARRLAGDLPLTSETAETVPVGVYYAVIGVHAATPGMADWHAHNVEELDLPPLYALDDVIDAFAAEGFEAAASRLKIGFVPVSDHAPSFPAGLQYFYEHKVVLRFARLCSI